MPTRSIEPINTDDLTIPEPAVARHPDTITKPRELRRWLEHLPLVDPTGLVKQLSRQLSLLIRDPHPDNKYRALLQLYHPTIRSLQEQASDIRKQSAETRSHAQISLLTSLPQLFLELAYGHMRAVVLTLEAGKPPDPLDIFTAQLLIRRSIHWELLEYRMLRPAIWQLAVQLYNLALLYRLQGVQLQCELKSPEDPSNIHDVFFSTLTLLLADPYRLPNHCIQELEQRLPGYAAKLDFSTDPHAPHRVPVELTGKLSPLHFARQPDPSLPASYVSIESLLSQLRPGQPDENGCDLDAWLSQSLGSLVKDNRERRHPRRARNADYHFIIGLEAMHERLRSLQPGNPDNAPTAPPGPTLCGIPCTQSDVSVSGAGFIIPGNQRYPDPGEWALFELDTPHGSGKVSGFAGQIKRCMRDEEEYLRIGVERLRGNVIPVYAGPAQTPALLNADLERKLYRLIVPRGYFVPGKQDTLFGSNKDYQVVHQKLLSNEAQTEVIELALMA